MLVGEKLNDMTLRRRDLMTAVGTGGLAMASANRSEAKGAPRAVRTTPDTVQTDDGVQLFIRDWGSGDPILFLAGWTLPSDFWAYQMVDLAAQGLRCIAYDRRGHGRSSDPGRGYDYDHLADDLSAIVESLDLKQVTIVAHSMASGEVAHYLGRHGGRRIRQLVLVSPTTPFLLKTADNPIGADGAALGAMRGALSRDFPAWIAANTAPFFTRETSPAMMAWGQSLMLQTSLQATVECAKLLAETDFREQLKQIRVPTLVIHGRKDVSAPLALTGAPTVALIPGARLSVYEDAPHGLPLTHIARLNKDLFAALRS